MRIPAALRSVSAPVCESRSLPNSPLPPKFQCSLDRKSTRLNSSHVSISYAVFCLKKKKLILRPLISVTNAPAATLSQCVTACRHDIPLDCFPSPPRGGFAYTSPLLAHSQSIDYVE